MSELLSYFLGTRHFRAFLIPWHGDFSMFSRTHTFFKKAKCQHLKTDYLKLGHLS